MPPTALSKSLAEIRFTSLVAWAYTFSITEVHNPHLFPFGCTDFMLVSGVIVPQTLTDSQMLFHYKVPVQHTIGNRISPAVSYFSPYENISITSSNTTESVSSNSTTSVRPIIPSLSYCSQIKIYFTFTNSIPSFFPRLRLYFLLTGLFQCS